MSPHDREAYRRELEHMRRIAHLFDDAFRIPVVGYRFGLDPILGLVPVIGDFSAFLFSAYLIFRAARIGAPRSLLVRMGTFAVADLFIGSVPLVGDVLDFLIKPNTRVVRLLERWLEREGGR